MPMPNIHKTPSGLQSKSTAERTIGGGQSQPRSEKGKRPQDRGSRPDLSVSAEIKYSGHRGTQKAPAGGVKTPNRPDYESGRLELRVDERADLAGDLVAEAADQTCGGVEPHPFMTPAGGLAVVSDLLGVPLG